KLVRYGETMRSMDPNARRRTAGLERVAVYAEASMPMLLHVIGKRKRRIGIDERAAHETDAVVEPFDGYAIRRQHFAADHRIVAVRHRPQRNWDHLRGVWCNRNAAARPCEKDARRRFL